MQWGNGHWSAWFEMDLPVTGVTMSFCADNSRVRTDKFELWIRGYLVRLKCAMLVRKGTDDFVEYETLRLTTGKESVEAVAKLRVGRRLEYQEAGSHQEVNLSSLLDV